MEQVAGYPLPREIAVSTAFFPSARHPNISQGGPDVIIRTSDWVWFYTHGSVLNTSSSNHFAGLLEPISPAALPGRSHAQSAGSGALITLAVDEESIIFNILLHLVYKLPCERYGPTVETIASTFGVFPKYGLSPPGPNADVWSILARRAIEAPLRVYGLGAYGMMDAVCIPASMYTLSWSLSLISEADALMMGPHYLRRLFQLHVGRVGALKRIIGDPPRLHQKRAKACSPESRKNIAHMWLAAAGDILLQELPQVTSVDQLLSAFGPISASTHCMQCKLGVQEHLSTVSNLWQSVSMTI